FFLSMRKAKTIIYHFALNFNKVNDNYFSFENSYHQDTFNSKLYMINKAFIEAYTEHRYQSSQLVPIHCMQKILIIKD
ncbi:MAG TPA: hypothetical protein PLF35_11420, partial [Prolixibacteraceae bacterium]|nr:hypothetical protein [Prolixibacteraceae bacterium]